MKARVPESSACPGDLRTSRTLAGIAFGWKDDDEASLRQLKNPMSQGTPEAKEKGVLKSIYPADRDTIAPWPRSIPVPS
jgi:hypothetical protein